MKITEDLMSSGQSSADFSRSAEKCAETILTKTFSEKPFIKYINRDKENKCHKYL